MYVLKRNNFSAILFFIVVFFIVFDGVRNNLVISPYLSLIREITLFLMLMLGVIYRKNIDKNYFNFFIPLILFSFFVISLWPITFFLDFSGFYFVEQQFGNRFSIYYKHFIFPFCFLAIYALLKSNEILRKKIIDIFILLSAVYGYITLPLYFFHLPFFNEVYKDYGRFGVGYPTMDGQIFILSLFFLSKFYTFIDSDSVAIDTVSMRENQYQVLNSVIKQNDIYYLFGVGAGSYVENQFLYVKTAFGNLGFVFYLITLIYFFILTFFIKNKNKFKIILLYMIFLLSSSTLLTIYFFHLCQQGSSSACKQ